MKKKKIKIAKKEKISEYLNRVYLQEHKKRVSSIKLIKHIDELKAVIKSGFEKFASSISYAVMLDMKIHEKI